MDIHIVVVVVVVIDINYILVHATPHLTINILQYNWNNIHKINHIIIIQMDRLYDMTIYYKYKVS